MKIIKNFLFGIFAILVIIFTGSVFLPSKYTVERSIYIKVPQMDIYPYIVSLKTWEQWSAWNTREDPTVKFTYQGPDSGVGALQLWKGNKLGEGTLKVTKDQAFNYAELDMIIDRGKFVTTLKVDLELVASGTKVTIGNHGELSMNPLSRLIGYFFMEKLISPDLETGLTNLKKIVENSRKDHKNI